MPDIPGEDIDWYEVVRPEFDPEVPLEQGDVLLEFPFTLPVNLESGSPGLSVARRDVVVLTQTCDIPKPAQQTILLAKIESYDSVCRNDSGGLSKSKKFRESLIQGQNISYFLLHERQGEVRLPWSLVSFRELAVAPKGEVLDFASKDLHRLRLRSPYKEHLAQGFARFMMRVGLPLPADAFAAYEPG